MIMKSTLKPCLHGMAVTALDLQLVLVEGAELSDVPSDECPVPCAGAYLAHAAVFVLGHCP